MIICNNCDVWRLRTITWSIDDVSRKKHAEPSQPHTKNLSRKAETKGHSLLRVNTFRYDLEAGMMAGQSVGWGSPLDRSRFTHGLCFLGCLQSTIIKNWRHIKNTYALSTLDGGSKIVELVKSNSRAYLECLQNTLTTFTFYDTTKYHCFI